MDGDLRKIFRRHLPQVAWTTIETGHVEPGVPDLQGCHDGVEFWVEMKQTTINIVKVQAAQVAWHTLRHLRGGRTFFAVRRHVRATDELFLIAGREAAKLRAEGLRATSPLLVCGRGPTAWDWGRVLSLLRG